jgi:hypothetical protein
MRLPGWATNEAVPSDLYHFTDKISSPIVLKVNGKSVQVPSDGHYATLERTWKRGDVVELLLPMPVRRIVANEAVEADRGRVALQRGPIVYCAEWPDNPDKHVRNLMLPDDSALSAEFKPELLNSVEVIKGKAFSLANDKEGKVQRTEQELIAIPYYAWANRGRGEMAVWLPNTEASAHPLPVPTIASRSRVRTSGGQNPRAINDLEEPRSSVDQTAFFHWWPKKGTTEWVEMTFEKPETISSTSVYWFDDTGIGECRIPKTWRLLYRDGDAWKPVEDASQLGVQKDRFNPVTFKPIATTALRMEVVMQPNWSAGIQEWKVK